MFKYFLILFSTVVMNVGYLHPMHNKLQVISGHPSIKKEDIENVKLSMNLKVWEYRQRKTLEIEDAFIIYRKKLKTTPYYIKYMDYRCNALLWSYICDHTELMFELQTKLSMEELTELTSIKDGYINRTPQQVLNPEQIYDIVYGRNIVVNNSYPSDEDVRDHYHQEEMLFIMDDAAVRS